MVSLNLSNNSLAGPIPSNITGLQNLSSLFLADNLFNGTIPYWAFSLPSLIYLDLEFNQLSGQLYDFKYQLLQGIYLSGNKLHGPVPISISKLLNLTALDLSSNNFSGDVDVRMFSNMKLLKYLDLSHNNLILTTDGVPNSPFSKSLGTLYLSSCGVKDIDFLRGANNLGKLDLSNNMLHGQIFSDQKQYEWGEKLNLLNLSHNFLTGIHLLAFPRLAILDLSSNMLLGPLPIPPVTTMLLYSSNNKLTGEIPFSICKLSSIIVLDLSKNSLSGTIPPCLVSMNVGLLVLDMHTNCFHGKIPATFAVGSKLRSLNLRNNHLEGTVPRSLSKCRELEVFDIGNNFLNGKFPRWLETLPNLQVLSLRSNNLRGPVSTSRNLQSFSAMRILDLSYNEFTGTLPTRFFRNLRGMMRVDESARQLIYMGDMNYQDSVVVVIKGQAITLVRILTTFTTLDLASNKFEGQIPVVIGNLISLRGLNLSHNTLAGQIPSRLGNLSVLESLDLSSNQLEGKIPQQLTALSYLSVFNLSQNQLVGSIPRGKQFDTFGNNSYIGNRELCGWPLSKSCGANKLPQQQQQQPQPPAQDEDDNEEFFSGFTWKSVLIGYCCGMVIGVIIGCLIFLTGKPKWFNKIVQEESSKLVRKKWPKYVKWL